MPSACAATLGRELLSDAKQKPKPAPGAPSRLARGTRQSSNASAAVPEARWPSLSSVRSTLSPGVPFSMTSAEIAACAVVDAGPFAEHEIEIGDVAIGDEALARR